MRTGSEVGGVQPVDGGREGLQIWYWSVQPRDVISLSGQ